MPSWDNDTSKGKLFYDYSDIHVLALFDEDILMYWKQLKAEDEKLIILHGDYECAIKSVNYKGKSIDVIINEIDSILLEANKQFQLIKTMALDRYLKL